jgi:hypothetical protein
VKLAKELQNLGQFQAELLNGLDDAESLYGKAGQDWLALRKPFDCRTTTPSSPLIHGWSAIREEAGRRLLVVSIDGGQWGELLSIETGRPFRCLRSGAAARRG